MLNIKSILDTIKNKELKITIVKNQVDILNYNEIIKFLDDLISIKAKDKKIDVIGNNLVVKKLMDNEVLIEGEISSVKLG